MRKTRSITERVPLPLGLCYYRTSIGDRKGTVMAWGLTPCRAQRDASARWHARQQAFRRKAPPAVGQRVLHWGQVGSEAPGRLGFGAAAWARGLAERLPRLSPAIPPTGATIFLLTGV